MSVQDDKEAGQEEDQKLTEKPEINEEHKQQAAEMMKAYKDEATVVLPGSGGMVSGTAVNDWLDEDGNPQHQEPDDRGSEDQATADEGRDDEARKEQIEKDKALNEELREASSAENKGEKR
ncbi:hypothetical protein [Mycobacterium sp. E3198]|uniref:hypothetical protein n=1 Tax=Mycobacterium sp. E3198 TaxID=1834143 RepID=UPI0008007B47|nr:hypothetical protein [Mycobacterium sp. E3198]OBG41492.1 hypothetical protein A5673_00450 [Mycobacterium sp. E3198]